ncbi:hypothetical protein Ahy_B02g058669 isoform E [Arachis hypogaea]|uniref:Uncharacterized protein n=1 Tax=Arachis hypogaea TaxID=3818 RepID=A0A445AF39_ARAHY|nr:hypothetical protein Ahy_B02g058669 isoform E [Arachis hypogaea]
MIAPSWATAGKVFSHWILPKYNFVSLSMSQSQAHLSVGAMAHGKIDAEYVDDLISVSALPLSAGTCLRRICVALERNQKIH